MFALNFLQFIKLEPHYTPSVSRYKQNSTILIVTKYTQN